MYKIRWPSIPVKPYPTTILVPTEWTFIDFIGDGSTGGRKGCSSQYRLFSGRVDCLLFRVIFQLIHHRRSLTQTQMIVSSTYPDSISISAFFNPVCFVNFLLYLHILSPERGTLHIGVGRISLIVVWISAGRRLMQICTPLWIEITPCFLKHVCPREEVHRYILIRHGRQERSSCV